MKGTRLLYAGRAANSWYTDPGGGVNYLCLPENPQFGHILEEDKHLSSIFGVEYEQPASDQSLDDYNVPCAVCHVKKRSSLVMIPAMLECPEKWTLEYAGYLMAERNDFSKSTFECVDQDFEALPGVEGNYNGGLFYNVEVDCTGLDCPPYVQGYELACVVCTM